MGKVSAPELLTINHQLADFNSNEPSLNDWLIKRALKNQFNGASRTFVSHLDMRVVGYYFFWPLFFFLMLENCL